MNILCPFWFPFFFSPAVGSVLKHSWARSTVQNLIYSLCLPVCCSSAIRPPYSPPIGEAYRHNVTLLDIYTIYLTFYLQTFMIPQTHISRVTWWINTGQAGSSLHTDRCVNLEPNSLRISVHSLHYLPTFPRCSLFSCLLASLLVSFLLFPSLLFFLFSSLFVSSLLHSFFSCAHLFFLWLFLFFCSSLPPSLLFSFVLLLSLSTLLLSSSSLLQ